MKRIFKFELVNCLNSTGYKCSFGIVMIVGITAFINNVVCYYGSSIQHMKHANELCIVAGAPNSGFLFSTLVMFLPILSSMIYSDSFYRDQKNNTFQYILTKVSIKQYILAKELVIVFISFLVATIPLLINYALVSIGFYKGGHDNYYGFPPYDIAIQNYDASYWLDFIRVQSPNCYVLIKIGVVGLCAATFALLAYALYFINRISEKNKFYVIGILFVLYLTSQMASTNMGNSKYNLYSYMTINIGGNTSCFIGIIGGLLILSNVIIWIYGVKKYEGIE